MANKNNRFVFVFLSLFITGVFIIPFVSSCGKGASASAAGYNTQLNILNLGPDVLPVNLYINFLRQGTTTYTYPSASGYFYLNAIDTPLQIRTAATSGRNLITLDSTFKANHKYSLYITGLLSNNTLTSIFTIDDTAVTPNIGFGKIRFVNAAIQPSNLGLDITANGTAAFTKQKFKSVTGYIQLPAGNYNFQINETGNTTSILATPGLTTVTIQDSRLYTLYTYGIVGRTDTSAFGAAVIINR